MIGCFQSRISRSTNNGSHTKGRYKCNVPPIKCKSWWITLVLLASIIHSQHHITPPSTPSYILKNMHTYCTNTNTAHTNSVASALHPSCHYMKPISPPILLQLCGDTESNPGPPMAPFHQASDYDIKGN